MTAASLDTREDRGVLIIGTIVDRLDGIDVLMDGREWRASRTADGGVVLRRWEDDDQGHPTGPIARITNITVTIEDDPNTQEGTP